MELQKRHRSALRGTAIGLLAATALLLTACSANQSSDSDAVSGGHVPAQQGEIAPDSSGGESQLADRQIISTGSISLIAGNPIEIADKAAAIAEEAGGHVDNRSDNPATSSSMASASLLLRIPADDLDDTIAEIKKLAELQSSGLTQTDVTSQVADLDARITALETSVARLLALMSQATTTSDLIELESALSSRQAELDGLKAQRAAVGDQVDFATIDVWISTPGDVVGAAPGDFWGGLGVGFQSLFAFFAGLLVVLGVLLPWLILATAITALVFWLLRRRRASHPRSPRQGPAPTRPYSPGSWSGADAAPAPEAGRPTDVPAGGAVIPPRPPLPGAPTSPATATKTGSTLTETASTPAENAAAPAGAKARTVKASAPKAQPAQAATTRSQPAKAPATKRTAATKAGSATASTATSSSAQQAAKPATTARSGASAAKRATADDSSTRSNTGKDRT